MDNNSVKYDTNNILDSNNTSSNNNNNNNNNNNSVLDNNQITPNNKTSNKIVTPGNNINSTPKNNNNNNNSNYRPNNINKDPNVTPNNNNNNNTTANYINSPNNNTPNNNNNEDDNQMSIYYTQLQNLLPQPQINNPQSRLQLLQNVIDYIADLEEMTSSSECTSDRKSYSESSATTPSLSGKLYPVSFTTATSSSSSSGYNKMASIVRNLNESFVVDSLVTFKMK